MRSSNLSPTWTALTLVVSLIAPYSAGAVPEFLDDFKEEYPAVVGTRLDSCQVCHAESGPPRRNPYGDDFNLVGRRFVPIESTDSDEDGSDNLTEILALTFPGNPLDGPNITPPATATPSPTNTPAATDTPVDSPTPTLTHTRKPTPTIIPGPCWGDCNEDGVVAINELVIAVRIALGDDTTDACPLIDDNEDGEVSINELVRAVNRALGGCPPQ